jgi:hypothetical protein
MAAMTVGFKLVLDGGNLKSPWVIDTTTEDGYEFVKLSLACRSFASLCGADMSTRAPLKDNSFLERLADLRDTEIVKLMKTANEARAVKLSCKEFVDEIDKYIVVHVPGFPSNNGFIDGAAIKVLVSSSSLASPSIEATPAILNLFASGFGLASTGRPRRGAAARDARTGNSMATLTCGGTNNARAALFGSGTKMGVGSRRR